MSVVPYTDQIWKSEFRDIETLAYTFLRRLKGSEKYHIKLVDLINKGNTNVITDNVVNNTNINCISVAPEFWGIYSYNPHYKNRIPVKNFNCFINRTCVFRQSWFYQFVRQNLLNRGNVSFNLEYRSASYKQLIDFSSSIEEKRELYDWIFAKGLDSFKDEHLLMRDKVPYQNFVGDLDQAVVDSKISIVIETYFDDDERQAIAFSEKIFRQLQLPRPFVLFCNPGAITALRNQGFDVYDDYVDHSYDDLHDNIQKQMRLIKIVDEFDNICYTQDMLDDFEKRAEHNRNLLIELKKKLPRKLNQIGRIVENT